MARYTLSNCRLCRREGMKLFLKGLRCYTKCPLEKKNYPPGLHGRYKKGRLTPYGVQLREKQKLKRIYGLMERQFRLYFERAVRLPGPSGENLLRLLEVRLDNVLWRSGLAWSHAHARQLIRHGKVRINGRKVDIPSYQVTPGDEIRLTVDIQQNPHVLSINEFAEGNRPTPPWLKVDRTTLTILVSGLPRREDIDFSVQEHMIVELYSK